MINVFQPALGAEELDAVGRVFASNWVGKGTVTAQFEEAFAGYLGVNRTLVRSVSCCTEGLFQAMTLLRVGPGDEVVLPSIHWVGAANAIVEAGAAPVFCDVDVRTLNVTAASIEPQLTSRTKAVLLLHYGGLPCEMDDIAGLLDHRHVALIEDSACSIASTYKGRACGTAGDIGVWSFDAMKIVVAGDGGMIYCRDAAMADQVERLVYLGLTSASGFTSTAQTRWWEQDVSCPGRRAIMNDIASAIGLEQLKKLPAFIDRRRQVHEAYDAAFAELEWLQTPPQVPPYAASSYYLYWIQMHSDIRDRLAPYLREKGIYTTFRYQPLHRVRLYGATGPLPQAEAAAETTLCIPLHQSLSVEDTDRVIEAIVGFRKHLRAV